MDLATHPLERDLRCDSGLFRAGSEAWNLILLVPLSIVRQDAPHKGSSPKFVGTEFAEGFAKELGGAAEYC